MIFLPFLLFIVGFHLLQQPNQSPPNLSGSKLEWVSLPGSLIPLLRIKLSDNQPHYFMLDTGSAPQQLDRSLAEKLLIPVQKVNYSGRDYDLVYTPANFGTLQLTFNRVPFYLADFRLYRQGPYPIEGVIGMSFLENFVIRMDYATKTLELYGPSRDAIGPDPDPKAIVFSLKTEKNGCRSIQGTVDGHSLNLVLDTGGEESGIGNPALLKKLKPVARVKGVYRGIQNEANDQLVSVNSSLARLKSLKIGPIEWKDPILTFDQRGGNFDVNGLGNDFLHHYKVTIDFPKNKLYLTPALPLNDEDEKWINTGAEFLYENGHIRVTQVLAPSPASDAGLVVGDEILSLNGTKVADARPDQMLDIWQSIKRKRETFTVELRTLDEKRPKKVKLKFKKLL